MTAGLICFTELTSLYNDGMQKIKDMTGRSRAVYVVIAVLCLILAFWIRTSTYRTWIKVTAIVIIVVSLLMIALLQAPVGTSKEQDSPYAPLLQQLIDMTAQGQEKVDRINTLADTLFGASSLTAGKFRTAAQSALDVLVTNVDQANRASQAFGQEPVTKDRELIFGNCIRESRSVLEQLDKLLLLLVQFDQTQDQDAARVTSQLQEITDTIHRCRHN